MLFDFAAITQANRYKLLISTIVPRPIAWVVTLDLQGRVNAAPFSFFNVLSQDPPILCIGIGGRAPGDIKDTGNNIRMTGQFVVNLVAASTAEQMNVTAIDFPPDIDELSEAGLTTLPSHHVKPPRIAESPVALECERFQIVELNSDRAIVMGKILAIHVRDEAVLDPERCYIDTPALDLVGRMHGSAGYTRTRDQFDLKRINLSDWTANR